MARKIDSILLKISQTKRELEIQSFLSNHQLSAAFVGLAFGIPELLNTSHSGLATGGKIWLMVPFYWDEMAASDLQTFAGTVSGIKEKFKD